MLYVGSYFVAVGIYRHQNVSKISQKGRFPAVHEDNNNPDPLSEQCLGISTMHLGAGRMAREQHGRRAVFASRQLESDYQMQQSPVILELTGTQVKGDVSDNRYSYQRNMQWFCLLLICHFLCCEHSRWYAVWCGV